MNLYGFFYSILIILLGLYVIAATAVILIFFPEAPQEVPRFAKWWVRYNSNRLFQWLKRTYLLGRATLMIWWDEKGWHVQHMFWLTLGSIALWLSVWGLHIIFFWDENDR